MRLFVAAGLLFIISTLEYTAGLRCHTCNESNFAGENSNTCLSGSSSSSVTCLSDSGPTKYYCRDHFRISDGVVTVFERGCVASTSDHDENTDGVPQNNECETVLNEYGNPTDTTNCYYSCGTDNCNTLTTENLKKCAGNCNIGSNQGSCDYIVGVCVCNTGWTGTNCENTASSGNSYTPRKCVQCNSATDTGCSSATSSVDCPGSERYCSTATTLIYDSADAAVKTVITRGCTSELRAVDECFFTDIYTDPPINSVGYNEFTCISTCDTDGCNTNSANGVVDGNEERRLYCFQCSDTSGTGYCNSVTSRSVCPSGTTHCKSTVTYLISERVDLYHNQDVPAYKLRSVVRECATAAVTSQCTESMVGSIGGLKKVRCTETCQEDGCNTGWPARPKCIQCDSYSSSISSAGGYDECLEHPPDATDCLTPYAPYCYVHAQGLEKRVGKHLHGYPRRVIRGCAPVSIGNSCNSATPRTTEIESCNYTCTSDGCNVGSGSSAPAATMIVVVTSIAFGWLAQRSLV